MNNEAPTTAWDAGPVLDGPSYAPRSPLEEARAAALVREETESRRQLSRRQQVLAQHHYSESIRQAEADALRRRLARLETQRDTASPLVRDAVLGGAAVTTPLLLAAGNNATRPELRNAVGVVAIFLGILAGREWMQHQHAHRIRRMDDEMERLQGRLSIRAIPQPSPFPDET